MSARLLLLICLFISRISGAQTTIVYFDFDNANLTRETKNVLDKLIWEKKIISMAINGHTDQMGSVDYNEWLSVQRAKAVKDYLLSKGLSEDKISVVRGFGAERLVNDQLDDYSRQLNRRVVLMNDYKPTPADLLAVARQSNLQYKPGISSKDKPPAETNTTTDKIAASPAPAVKKVEPVVHKEAPIVQKEQPVVKQQKSEKLIEDIKDNNTKAGENIVLKNINFHPGSRIFLEGAIPSLEDLAETMQKIATLEIEIQGHVCCQEGDTDALDNATGEMKLSVNRAKAVYDYLIEKGIAANRLSYKGLAHQYPLIKVELSEADRIANRRVEIKIIKK